MFKYLGILLLPSLLEAAPLAQALTVLIDGDAPDTPQAVLNRSTSVRRVPGKFGQGWRFERRTRNYATRDQLILSAGASLQGASNRLTLPAHGLMALPLIGYRLKAENFLSFRYRGSGTISVTLKYHGKSHVLGQFKAQQNFQTAGLPVIIPAPVATLKLRSTHPVELDQLQWDVGINQANSYVAPGRSRGIDRILLKPQLYNRRSGALVMWIKAPWCVHRGQGNGMGLFEVCVAQPDQKRPVRIKGISVWAYSQNRQETYFYDSNYGIGKLRSCSTGFPFMELKNTPDNWHQVVFNWQQKNDQLEISTAIDGEIRCQSRQKFTPNPHPVSQVSIGGYSGIYANGVLDDIALFNRPLTLSEIRQIYRANQPLRQLLK